MTTKVQNIEYYLLCIFGVNIPLLCGEGPRAFIRLQEEIIKRSDDEPISFGPSMMKKNNDSLY
jgi:hypothetical protein